jgi:hypothetical protein
LPSLPGGQEWLAPSVTQVAEVGTGPTARAGSRGMGARAHSWAASDVTARGAISTREWASGPARSRWSAETGRWRRPGSARAGRCRGRPSRPRPTPRTAVPCPHSRGADTAPDRCSAYGDTAAHRRRPTRQRRTFLMAPMGTGAWQLSTSQQIVWPDHLLARRPRTAKYRRTGTRGASIAWLTARAGRG